MAKKSVDQSTSSSLLAANSQKRNAQVSVVPEASTFKDTPIEDQEPPHGLPLVPDPPITDSYSVNSEEDQTRLVAAVLAQTPQSPYQKVIEDTSIPSPKELLVEFNEDIPIEISQLAGKDLIEIITKIKANIANPIEKELLLTLATTPSQDHEIIFEKIFSNIIDDEQSSFLKDLMNDAF